MGGAGETHKQSSGRNHVRRLHPVFIHQPQYQGKKVHGPNNRLHSLSPGRSYGIFRSPPVSAYGMQGYGKAGENFPLFNQQPYISQVQDPSQCGNIPLCPMYPTQSNNSYVYQTQTNSLVHSTLENCFLQPGIAHYQPVNFNVKLSELENGSHPLTGVYSANNPYGTPGYYTIPSNPAPQNQNLELYHQGAMPFHFSQNSCLSQCDNPTFPPGCKTNSSFDNRTHFGQDNEADFKNGSFHYLNADSNSIQQIHTTTKCVEIETEVTKDAITYAESTFPNLGKQLYCVPPLKRFRHPDKSNRQLMTRIESEKRVQGSFEQYFSFKHSSVVMLRNYSINGFLHYRLDEPLTDMGKSTGRYKKPSTSRVISLILLSSLFPVTIITVNTVRGNSDFTFIQNAVNKATGHTKQCGNAVRQWLSLMVGNVNVREITAFPNLRKSVVQKAMANSSSFSQISTLLMDDLSAPFEEEWSTTMHKLNFTDWIQSHEFTGESGPSLEQLKIIVGTMCCPQISNFESKMDEMDGNTTTRDNIDGKSQNLNQGVNQLSLTIDGVTKNFDEYMEDFASHYFPNLDTETYRVPPIHFNIQTYGKLNEDIFFSNAEENMLSQKHKTGNSCDGNCSESASYLAARKSNKHFLHRPRRHTSQIDCMTTGHYKSTGGERSECVKNMNTKKVFKGIEHHSDTDVEKMKNTESTSGVDLQTTVEMTSTKDAKLREQLQITMEDVHVLLKTMSKDMRADEGESRVMSAFEMLGKKYGPMFIICSYQYNNYLNKLREEMFSEAEVVRPVRAFGQKIRAEHDCLIFHKNYGAIIVCIKAIGDNFEEWKASEDDKIKSIINIMTKALKQLDREANMVHYINSDFAEAIACHKLISFPNVYRADVTKALSHAPDLLQKLNVISDNLGVDAILCRDELPTQFCSLWNAWEPPVKDKLYNWWQNICSKMAKEDIDSRTYNQIVGRYCGLLSTVEVWTQTSPRIEVRSISEATRECSERFSKVLLLPEQVTILQLNLPRVFLHGPPGCGKTMLLMLKAREWLCKGFKVIWLNVRMGFKGYPFAFGVERKLRATLNKLKLPQNNLKRVDVDSRHFNEQELAWVLPSNQIIIDEVSPSSHRLIEHLCNLHVDKIWSASIREESCPVTARGFQSFQLKRIMRCPPTIQHLMKSIEQEIDSDKKTSTYVVDITADNVEDECGYGKSECANSDDKNETNLKDIIPTSQDGGTHAKNKVILPHACLNINNFESYSLPTEGPQPIFVYHKDHGLPMNSALCAQELAKCLHDLFQSDNATSRLKNDFTHYDNHSVYARVNDYKAIKRKHDIKGDKPQWMDGLIVSRVVNKNSLFVKELLRSNINVEVVTESAANRRLEDPAEDKLFFTMCHEATGLERRVVVFVPSELPIETAGGEYLKNEVTNSIDVRLQSYLSCLHENDKRALWHMASRTLSLLILIVP